MTFCWIIIIPMKVIDCKSSAGVGGGIVGQLDSPIDLHDVHIHGTVTATMGAGGIVGAVAGPATGLTIDKSSVHGNVSSSTDFAGGIVALILN
jgi:hypothetical protein